MSGKFAAREKAATCLVLGNEYLAAASSIALDSAATQKKKVDDRAQRFRPAAKMKSRSIWLTCCGSGHKVGPIPQGSSCIDQGGEEVAVARVIEGAVCVEFDGLEDSH